MGQGHGAGPLRPRLSQHRTPHDRRTHHCTPTSGSAHGAGPDVSHAGSPRSAAPAPALGWLESRPRRAADPTEPEAKRDVRHEDQVDRAVDPRDRGPGVRPEEEPLLARPHGLRHRRHHRRGHLHVHRARPPRPTPGRRSSSRSWWPRSSVGWPPSATPSSPRPCRCPARPTRSPTPSLGELVAWIIGWDLLLELALGAGVVSQGWSQYANLLLGDMGINLPDVLAPRTDDNPGGQFDLLAFLLIAVLTALVAWGIKESMRVNLVLVAIKLFVVLFVIIAGHRPTSSPPTTARSSRPRWPARAVEGIKQPLIQAHLRLHAHALTASAASSPAPRSSSSPTSGSTSWPPPPRRPRSPSATCPSASSPRW